MRIFHLIPYMNNDNMGKESMSKDNMGNENMDNENMDNENMSNENMSNENMSNENMSNINMSNENIGIEKKAMTKKSMINNKGASLIMVLIGCAFVMTLGTIIIASALRNVEMKAVERKSKKNFYSAEAALEEIKINLAETVSNNLADAYDTVLTQYSVSDEASRVLLFQNTFSSEMKTDLLVQSAGLVTNEIVPIVLLNSYLEETKLVSGIGAQVITAPSWRVLAGDGILLEGLALTYQEADYITTLSTDIKIKYPGTTFGHSGGYSEQLAFQYYSLIADEYLQVESGVHEVKGSIYAGLQGIQVENSNTELEVLDGTVISAGNIIVKNKGELVINSPLHEIWAVNLVTTQSNKAEEQLNPTTFHINGRSFVQDDLVIDAKRSDIVFTGEYYGFSAGNGPMSNSAIMINASNASLDLGGLSKLTLAGRAFVNLSNISDPALDGSSIIQTGESLAVKGSQNSYLLPEEYVTLGHNPVTWKEYSAAISAGSELVNIPANAKIFIHDTISAEESKLNYYLHETEPVKKAFYKFDSSIASSDSNIVYYYLNFKTQELATTYFKNYRKCYPEDIYNDYPIDEIVLNSFPGTVVTSGNLMTFDGSEIGIMAGNNGSYLNNHNGEFGNLCQTLQKNVPGSGGVFANIIDTTTVANDGVGSGGVAYEVNSAGPAEYMVVVKDGDYTLNDVNQHGLIIATGDVDVNQSFRGLILSGGKIQLFGDSKVEADNELIVGILQDHIELHPYFYELKAGGSTTATGWNSISAANLIGYENWRKN